ncbi:MAG: sulfotransferase [Gammaproteobacteria bacterium]|nr:sulfotransferase [Gammaproteobacteria bacterium]
MEETTKMSSSSTNKVTCIYIAGRGHSGSTLLTLLLGRHPEIAAVGELANLSLQCHRKEGLTKWAARCGCGERPFNCSVWKDILNQVHEFSGIDMQKDPFAWHVSDVGLEEEYRSSAPRKTPLIWARNKFWRLWRYAQYSPSSVMRSFTQWYRPQISWARNRSFIIEKFAEKQKARAVVDASKDALGMCDMYYYSPLPVKILFITRDCRGSVWSMAKHAKSEQERVAKILEGTHEWMVVNRRIVDYLKLIPSSDWLHLKYEDLCHNPPQVMKNVFTFLGFKNPPDILATTDIQEHTIAGNKIRLSGNITHIREDTAWSENLTQDELQNITRLAGDFAATLGYQL